MCLTVEDLVRSYVYKEAIYTNFNKRALTETVFHKINFIWNSYTISI